VFGRVNGRVNIAPLFGLINLIYYCNPKYPKINDNIQFTFNIVLYQDKNMVEYINLTLLYSNIIFINQ